MSTPSTVRKASLVGPYELLEKLGEGGMGAVHKARKLGSRELVAVKLLSPDKTSNAIVLKRFEQEFRAALRLDHPHVVRVLDFGASEKFHYLVMELVEGTSLGARIAKKGRLKEAEAVEIILQVATGLQQIHEADLVHRDVKPDNIMLAAGGVAKLSDLGLVKVLDDGVDLTRPNTGLGTPNFMAPEQFSDARHADARCDLYSLAATLYHAVTGEVPFRASSPVGVFRKKQAGQLTPVRSLVPGVGEAVERVINRSLSLDPRNRHASCKEFLADLTARAAARSAQGVRRAETPPPPKPPLAPGKEQRAYLRHPSKVEGRCQPIASFKEDQWTTRIVDISRNGVGLIVNRRFEVGTLLVVYPHQADTPPFLVRVARLRVRSSRKWHLGCVFANLLSDGEVQGVAADHIGERTREVLERS
ncbi:MAG: serine/threonine-protein kinase [Gemmataceae bacterium]